MSTILVKPEEVEQTSSQFAAKHSDLQQLIQFARNQVSALQGSFQGNRATKFYGEWDSMQPGLEEALASLQRASELLKAAAAAFRQADLQ